VDRRAFVTGLGAVLVAPLAAEAQPPAAGVHRIGFLDPGLTPTATNPGRILPALRGRLTDLGYREGHTLTLEIRFADGDAARLPLLANELVQLRPSIIVTVGSAATIAAKRATATIPIVMATSLDPIRDGLAESLQRPGGNVTGLSQISDAELIGKRFQLAKEIMPRAKRVALVPAPPPLTKAGKNWLQDAEAAARSTAFSTQILKVLDLQHWEHVFAAAVQGRADVVYLIDWGPYIAYAKEIADQALRARMPTVFGASAHVVAGGLLAYGTNVPEMARRAGDYVDKILKGAKPANLPIEQPTKFELVINLKTAKALGLTIPPSLLLRADQVIE